MQSPWDSAVAQQPHVVVMVVGSPPNKRLELAARGDYGMNQLLARRSSGAIR